jgi:hypothetical protein
VFEVVVIAGTLIDDVDAAAAVVVVVVVGGTTRRSHGLDREPTTRAYHQTHNHITARTHQRAATVRPPQQHRSSQRQVSTPTDCSVVAMPKVRVLSSKLTEVPHLIARMVSTALYMSSATNQQHKLHDHTSTGCCHAGSVGVIVALADIALLGAICERDMDDASEEICCRKSAMSSRVAARAPLLPDTDAAASVGVDTAAGTGVTGVGVAAMPLPLRRRLLLLA